MEKLTLKSADIQAIDSREVAEMLEMRHSDILRKVEQYVEVLTNAKLRSLDYFIKSSYKDKKGEERTCYLFTKMGCEFIANKFTGEKGILFTAKYVKRFNEMQQVMPQTANDLEKVKLEMQKQRANAMELNAKTRAYKTIMQSIEKHKNLSPIAIEVFGLKALESAFGADVGNYLPQVEKTYSATEVGEMLGISANKVGRLANLHGLKTPEYGRFVADKAKNSDKEVESFRYNEIAVRTLQQLH